MGDCEALPTGDRITLPMGDRSHLGAFHIRFPFGKTLTVNVFRQRINQLFQGGGDIWRAIAKHSLREIAFSVPPGSFSREKPERVDKRLRSTPFGRSRSIPYGRLRSTRYARSHYILNGRSLSSRCISYSVPIWENIDGKRFSSKDKSVISRGWGYLEGDC
ncbi:hypothetical protein [Cylindrospermopsis curvispora]|uniref:hypothetical protein n=1 Tax=Cylindrospermopsis curvispora TaxID=747548 RepID=UPI001F48FC3D|nr:hypothetical protein [Cylindrospermopsis curvispora]